MDVWFSLALPGLLLDLAPILDGKGQNSLSGSCLEDARELIEMKPAVGFKLPSAG